VGVKSGEEDMCKYFALDWQKGDWAVTATLGPKTPYTANSEEWKAELTLVLVIYQHGLPVCKQSPIQDNGATNWESNPRPYSLCLIPGLTRPDPLQEVPEASKIRVESSSWPDVSLLHQHASRHVTCAVTCDINVEDV